VGEATLVVSVPFFRQNSPRDLGLPLGLPAKRERDLLQVKGKEPTDLSEVVVVEGGGRGSGSGGGGGGPVILNIEVHHPV